jgi:V/A-type H+-transporting ATPase subunit D
MSPARRIPRHPPGRGGRVWLQRRLVTARRGAGLLDLRLRVLCREEERFTALAQRTGTLWDERCTEAERWLLRAAAVGGQRGLRPDGPAGSATVDISWASVMGVRYPASATCRIPPVSPCASVPATAALPLAAGAYRAALEAGVAHAVAHAAARVVAAEVVTTRGRLRAIEDRWIPELEAGLHALDVALDELERAEAVRLRWAVRQRGGQDRRRWST